MSAMSRCRARISSPLSTLEPSAAKASSFSASGRILSPKVLLIISSDSAVPWPMMASRGISSLNVAFKSAVVLGSATGFSTASRWTSWYILNTMESISETRRSHWNCTSVNAF